MLFQQYYLGCLAHASYLIGDGGEAVIVDPQRDVDGYIEDAKQRGLVVRHVIETHLHADFVSGHGELAKRTGAKIYVGRGSGARFDHVPADDGLTVRVGKVTLRFLQTPGHTPESVSILVEAPGEPTRLLTGDFVFIGDVGRPDLAGLSGYTAEQMAGMLYDSIRNKLLPLPDSIEIWPAHGAGSACGKNISSARSSTLGEQKKSNYALQPMTRAQFVDLLCRDLPAAPSYFPMDAELNRTGAASLSELRPLTGLSPTELRERASSATILDVREPALFFAGHVPGAINIGLDGTFAPWAASLLDPSRDILLVFAEPAACDEARVRLARVGLERLVGFLEGGMTAWQAAGFPTSKIADVSAQELRALLDRVQVVDVRRPAEHEKGLIAGSLSYPLDRFRNELPPVDKNRPVVVTCASGYRSAIACSLLARAGFADVRNLTGGMSAWLA